MTTPDSLVICPIVTLLDDREELDVPSFRRLIEHLLPFVDGLFVLGSSGEFATLRSRVKSQAVRELVGCVGGRVPVYAGIGDTGTARALDNLAEYVELGVDAVVACAPYYFAAPDQAALARHFTDIADRSTVPVVLYNIPQYTGNSLEPATLQDLAQHPSIAGLKDSSADLILFQKFLAARGPNFRVFQGSEYLGAASLWLGADGIVSSLVNVAPELFRRLAAAVHAGDRDLALELQRQVTAAGRVFGVSHFVTGLKGALQIQGFGGGEVARPIARPTDAEVELIRAVLATSGLGSPA
jgi:dihydrodipicolinate synthase/N-acetylneuraminate lyase